MSDEEEAGDTGLGTLAAYTLGRWSAESDAELSRTVSSLQRAWRREPTIADFQAANDALASANQSLLEENAQLRQQLADYKHNYRRMKEWAAEIRPLLDRLNNEEGK